MKTKIFLLLMVVATVFFSCKKTHIDTTTPSVATRVAPDGKQVVQVSFNGNAAPKTYAGTFAAENPEKALMDGVRVYIFSDNGGVPDKVVGTDDVVFATAPTMASNTEAGVKGTFLVNDVSGNFHVVAVANYSKQSKDIINMTYDQFTKLVVDKAPGIAGEFVMVSEPYKITLTQGAPKVAIDILLRRLAARIDVINHATKAGNEFVLEKVYLESAKLESRLIQYVDANLGGPSNRYFQMAANNQLYAKLYTYENHEVLLQSTIDANPISLQSKATHVIVSGTYRGAPAQFRIAFGDKAVKRNTRYLIDLQNVISDNQIQFNIIVDDWIDGGNITFNPALTGVPVVKTITGGFTGDNNTTAINVSNPATTLNFDVTSPAIQAEFVVIDAAANPIPWVSIQDITTYAMNQQFKLNIANNADLYSRTAKIIIRNKFDPKYYKEIQVTQAGNANPDYSKLPLLARLSLANVGELNQFADVITESNITSEAVKGMYYQWGRNIAFKPGNPIIPEVISATLSANDPKLWTPNIYYVTNGQFWNIPATTTNLWASTVMQSNAAPASYIGTNGGDPCPTGWKLVDYPQSRNLFPYFVIKTQPNWTYDYQFYSGNLSRTNTETFGGVEYTEQYYSNTPNVVYAVKMKGGDNSKITAYKYEYRGARGLKITARLLGTAGASVNASSIATDAYWTANNDYDISRLIPKAGFIFGNAATKEGFHFRDHGTYFTSNIFTNFATDPISIDNAQNPFGAEPLRCIKQ